MKLLKRVNSSGERVLRFFESSANDGRAFYCQPVDYLRNLKSSQRVIYQKFQRAEILTPFVECYFAATIGFQECELKGNTLYVKGCTKAVFTNGEDKTASFPKFEEKG
jgi:hypothetical protein